MLTILLLLSLFYTCTVNQPRLPRFNLVACFHVHCTTSAAPENFFSFIFSLYPLSQTCISSRYTFLKKLINRFEKGPATLAFSARRSIRLERQVLIGQVGGKTEFVFANSMENLIVYHLLFFCLHIQQLSVGQARLSLDCCTAQLQTMAKDVQICKVCKLRLREIIICDSLLESAYQ